MALYTHSSNLVAVHKSDNPEIVLQLKSLNMSNNSRLLNTVRHSNTKMNLRENGKVTIHGWP